MKTKIYTAYHQAAPIVSGAVFEPIQVGRAIASSDLRGMIGDDTGSSISDKNGSYCELTALYWAWKNDTDSDYIGLMHYRRFLDLSEDYPSGTVEQSPKQFEIDSWVDKAEHWIERNIEEYDVVLPRPHIMGRTVANNYAAGHEVQDFELTRDIIARDHPEYLQTFNTVADLRQVRLANMCIMKRPLFDRYCAWLFDILFKVEAAQLDRSTYTRYQMRYLGFLSERLFTVFIAYEESSLKMKEVSILNLAGSMIVPSVTKEMRVGQDSIAIAFAADRNYLPHAATMVQSVLDHADAARAIDFIFLYSDVEPKSIAMLREIIEVRSNIRLHAVDIGGAFATSYRSASRAPSNATYNRFLLFELLRGFDRLVYLDSDVIVRTDLAKLFDTDMGDAEIGGVTDWIMTRTLTGPTPTADRDTPDLGDYHRDTLGLTDDQIGRYFNAGVLLLNFAAMEQREGGLAAVGSQLMEEVHTGRYMFRDQDILNKVFKDSLHVLDGRWNVFNTAISSYGRVPASGFAQAVAAKADPWIIHYADRDHKPWDHVAVSLSHHYWQTLIRTPFYGKVIQGKQSNSNGRSAAKKRSFVVRTGQKLGERFPSLMGPLLRIYSVFR